MAQQLASVSYVMPVLNEERYLRAAVLSIFEQRFAGPVEVILALGPSTDATDAIAAELAANHPVTLVRNPTGTTSAGLNLAIAAAKYDVVVRVDAHSKLNTGYTQLAVEVLNQTGAANVGGVMKAVGQTPFQKAVAWGYTSRFGLGGGSFHIGGQAGPSDSVYLGVFRRSVLLELGGFDESVIRGQDWELNARLRENGKTVWFDPSLRVGYYPRRDIVSLAKQFFGTGVFRAYILMANPKRTRIKYLVPPTFIASLLIGLVALIVSGNWWMLLPGYAYIALVLFGALTASGLSLKSRIALLAVLPTMHLSWGAGFWKGIFTFSNRGDDVVLNTAAISVHS